jgi:hypothetical protein
MSMQIMARASRMKEVGSPISRRGVALLALVGLMILLLVPLFPVGEEDGFRENLLNFAHVPLFVAVTLLLRFMQLSLPPRWGSLFLCAFGSLLLAVLSEMAQSVTGRTPAVGDLAADLSGILLACAGLMRGASWWALSTRLMLLVVGGGLLALAVRPLVAEIQTVRAKREAFPTLVDMEFPYGLWQAQGATRLRVVGGAGRADGHGLEVSMASGSYEGLRYAVPGGVDAVDYSGLLIETVNPGEAFELGVRVDCGVGQRQYRSFLVPNGRSVLQTEWVQDREDGELIRLVLFTGEKQPARKFQILDARLVGEKPGIMPADP